MKVDWLKVKFPFKTTAFAVKYKFDTVEDATRFLGQYKFNGLLDSVGRGCNTLWFPTKALMVQIWEKKNK